MMQFDELWDFGQPEGTRQRFLPLLKSPYAEADIDYRVQLLTQIARTHSLQGAFTAAHHVLDDAEPLLTDTSFTTKARYLLERGRTFNSAGKKGQARELFLQALEAAEHAALESVAADYYIVDALHMLGIVGSPDKQIEWSSKGLAYAEQSKDERTRSWLGALYNNIGWSYHDMGEYKEALKMFTKGVKWRQQQGDGQALRLARWAVGRALRSLARYEEAYRVHVDLLREHQVIGSESGYVYEEIAECCFLMGFEATGRVYAHLAERELSKDQWLVVHEAERLERLKRLWEPV